MLTVLLCLGALALWFYVREKLRACTLKAVLLKAAVSSLFVAVGAYGAWRSASASGAILCPFVLLGLVFGLQGDIWLDLKYAIPEKDEPFTYAGFGAFALGHLCYLTGLLLAFAPAGRPLFVIVPLLLALGMSAANLALEKPMKLRFGKLRPVVFGYGVLLFATLLLSGSLALAHSWREGTLNLFFAGAALFALSDLVLSGTYFGVGKDRPVDIILNYLSYYPAQFLIALSLLLLK